MVFSQREILLFMFFDDSIKALEHDASEATQKTDKGKNQRKSQVFFGIGEWPEREVGVENKISDEIGAGGN